MRLSVHRLSERGRRKGQSMMILWGLCVLVVMWKEAKNDDQTENNGHYWNMMQILIMMEKDGDDHSRHDLGINT